MTGYGKGESQGLGVDIEIEVKSVNHRFLEITTRLPRFLTTLESLIREKVREVCHRGKVDIVVTVTPTGEEGFEIEIDWGRAMAIWSALEQVAEAIGRKGELHLSHLLAHQEVFNMRGKEQDPQLLWGTIEEALGKAINAMIQERQREGEALKKDILSHLTRMEHLLSETAHRAPDLPQLYRNRLRERLRSLKIEVPPERLAQEVALMAERTDISEEVVRLRTHLGEMRETLMRGSPCGRKLDFLAQEALRESNTIASKAQDAMISHMIVEMKGEIEKMREQIQNVE